MSTLAVFSDLQVDPNLFYIVFGESVLNDAVGIVLFETAKEFVIEPDRGQHMLPSAVGSFVSMLLGSFALGIAITIVVALICARVDTTMHLPVEQVGFCVLCFTLPLKY